mmetsp:Transcript_5618/g.11128  ORF Transcript_5618/g.11128 Transcript_5618/m.11128 type:complete len:107 (-) Transcript_5618:1142-1462(-)
MKCLLPEIVYVMTISEEGIVRFHAQPRDPIRLLLLARAESRNCFNWFKNMFHFFRKECFCLGVFYEVLSKETESNDSGKGILAAARFNRWADNGRDLGLLYAVTQD